MQTQPEEKASVTNRAAKRVVSVSLGTSKRDLHESITLLGEQVELIRMGVDGDLARAQALIRELDGEVDAIGLGGINLNLNLGKTRYILRDAAKLASQATLTPVVDGAGLKESLEKHVVERLNAEVGLQHKKVLMVSAVERFGMAQALLRTGAEMHYGDLISILGVPLPLRSLLTLRALAYVLLPCFRHAPISWLYPTGAAQDKENKRDASSALPRFYTWAEVIAGDWHLIRRYLPSCLAGKIILTNTTTREDVALLRARGARLLVTTTPRIAERSVATNLLEAAFVAVSGGRLLTLAETDALVVRSGLEGTFIALQKGSSE